MGLRLSRQKTVVGASAVLVVVAGGLAAAAVALQPLGSTSDGRIAYSDKFGYHGRDGPHRSRS
jgi:hypothetical protein